MFICVFISLFYVFYYLLLHLPETENQSRSINSFRNLWLEMPCGCLYGKQAEAIKIILQSNWAKSVNISACTIWARSNGHKLKRRKF